MTDLNVGPRQARRWPLSRVIGVALLVLLLFSVAAIVAGGIALLNLHDDRQRVLDVLDPAVLQVQRLDTALVNQETGVRGYALSGQKNSWPRTPTASPPSRTRSRACGPSPRSCRLPPPPT